MVAKVVTYSGDFLDEIMDQLDKAVENQFGWDNKAKLFDAEGLRVVTEIDEMMDAGEIGPTGLDVGETSVEEVPGRYQHQNVEPDEDGNEIIRVVRVPDEDFDGSMKIGWISGWLMMKEV